VKGGERNTGTVFLGVSVIVVVVEAVMVIGTCIAWISYGVHHRVYNVQKKMTYSWISSW
jgi:hypothetical protein